MNLRIQSFTEYTDQYNKSVENPEEFWSEVAEKFKWRKKWDSVLSWNFDEPMVKWFEGGKLNITENLLDRHLETKGDDIAYYWEPNNPNDEARSITYRELYHEVCKF